MQTDLNKSEEDVKIEDKKGSEIYNFAKQFNKLLFCHPGGKMFNSHVIKVEKRSKTVSNA